MSAVSVMEMVSKNLSVIVLITEMIVKEPVVVQLVLMFVVNVVILLKNHVVFQEDSATVT